MQKHKPKKKPAWPKVLASIALFAAAFAIFSIGTSNIGSRAEDEGLASTKRAIERAAILCYATEGFYPPGLSYIEENYGVRIDDEHYVVQYDIFAMNIMPAITVKQRQTP